ncbi:MAG: GNAT family N-acetyltransferase [Cocleimonas sp.]
MKLQFRLSTAADLEALVSMLADDVIGTKREDVTTPLNKRYINAFQHINVDPNNELIIAEISDQIVGMLQLTFIPYLTYIGSWRCLIEGVRIHVDYRGQGLGEKMFQWAINRAKERDCQLVQLTSDKQRPDAIRFYERLGFTASHEGFKLKI